MAENILVPTERVRAELVLVCQHELPWGVRINGDWDSCQPELFHGMVRKGVHPAHSKILRWAQVKCHTSLNKVKDQIGILDTTESVVDPFDM